MLSDKAIGLLGIARKAGKIELGEDPVGNLCKAGKARLLILASDAADHTLRRAASFAGVHETPLAVLEADKSQLGLVFGRSSLAMAAFSDVSLAESFLHALGQEEKYRAQIAAVHEKAEYIKQRKQTRGKGKKGKR